MRRTHRIKSWMHWRLVCVETASSILSELHDNDNDDDDDISHRIFLSPYLLRIVFFIYFFCACATTTLVLPTYIFLVLDVFIISVFRWHRYVVNGHIQYREWYIGDSRVRTLALLPPPLLLLAYYRRHERNILGSIFSSSLSSLHFTHSFQCTIDLVNALRAFDVLMLSHKTLNVPSYKVHEQISKCIQTRALVCCCCVEMEWARNEMLFEHSAIARNARIQLVLHGLRCACTEYVIFNIREQFLHSKKPSIALESSTWIIISIAIVLRSPAKWNEMRCDAMRFDSRWNCFFFLIF